MRDDFKGTRALLNREITIHAPADDLFPLLCPVREGEWLPGWVGKAIYATNGVAEVNGVFAVEHLGAEDSIWYVLQHELSTRQVEFLYFVPNEQVVRLHIAVAPVDARRSTIAVKYIRTAISDAGNTVIGNADAQFDAMMTEWERVMNHFMTTGRRYDEQR